MKITWLWWWVTNPVLGCSLQIGKFGADWKDFSTVIQEKDVESQGRRGLEAGMQPRGVRPLPFASIPGIPCQRPLLSSLITLTLSKR